MRHLALGLALSLTAATVVAPAAFAQSTPVQSTPVKIGFI